MLYGGLPLRPGQQVLTTTHDHYATHENLRLAAARAGGGAVVSARSRCTISPSAASEEEIVRRLVAAVEPHTRVVAVTWVHSSTGVKLPIRRLAAAVADLNRKRDPAAQILFAVDGVHGFGVERESPHETGLRLLRRRLPQVDVRPARHRRVVGPPRRLEGPRRPDRPVRAAALHRLDQGPHPLGPARP